MISGRKGDYRGRSLCSISVRNLFIGHCMLNSSLETINGIKVL